MKIAISSDGNELGSRVSEIFGRCPYFIIVEVNEGKIVGHESVANASVFQRGGAGISSAQLIAEKGANAVVAGSIGPRAMDILRQLKIGTYRGVGTVESAALQCAEGKLTRI